MPEFPNPTITGIRYVRFKEVPTDWDAVTDSFEFEDAGKTFNDRTNTPPREWEVGFAYLTYGELQIFEDFNATVRRSLTFSFTDKFGETYTGVRIKDYTSNHDSYKSWTNSCSFRLVKYPT